MRSDRTEKLKMETDVPVGILGADETGPGGREENLEQARQREDPVSEVLLLKT